MKGIFITGTDTDVGKTMVSIAIVRALRCRGHRVGALKPFASGTYEDTILLKKAAQMTEDLKTLTPFYFKYPLAPYASLKLERRSLKDICLRKSFKPLERKYDYFVVEGIGGASVPITPTYSAIDTARDLRIPAVIVGRLSLGTLNHTLLTIEYIRHRRIPIKGIILNTLPPTKRGLAERTNPQVLEKLSGVPVLGVVPWVSSARRRQGDFLSKIAEKHIELASLLC